MMMMRMVLLMVVVGVGASLDFRTIMTYLNDKPEFSILAGLLHDSHLDIVLEANGAIFTLFAPTNTAFNRLAPDVLNQIKGDPNLLQKVLMAHVLNSAFISIFMSNDHAEPSLSGGNLRFNVYNRTYTVNGAPITLGDQVLRNGVIHVIDGVILPAEGSILRQVLTDDAEFEDLTAALAVTNLLEELEGNPITLFAPLNSAFRAYYNASLPSDLSEVRAMLENHIVNGTYYTQGLPDGTTLTTLSAHTLTFTRTLSGELMVNGQTTDGVIYATNGVIHVMTSVLGPDRR
ncbi:transforming growth factor-beta-induced protein ig-h3-like [Littorina saxatilis]|uniref:transforming growth factor-beta-induced protein ig-h3-like n=1 Tax=Littorina saxatilis TaxID=31220 RepID=UPI0038B52172